LWAWVTAAAVCALGAYLLLFYHWAIVANPLVWTTLVATKGDDRAYVAAKVLSGDLRNADIVLLGTSATRYAFWPEPILEAALRQRGERDARIVNLSSDLQSPIESLFLTTIGETRHNQDR